MSLFKNLVSNTEKSLKIIIVGVGKVGSALADKLSSEGNEITIVDKNRELVNKLSTTYDILGITGNGSSYSTLIEAGVETADLVIAVTNSDELNLLCCTLAKKVRNCATIARVRTPDYSNEFSYLRDKLGISVIINPELETAREINRILHFPSAISVNAFAKGSVDMIKFKIPSDSILDGVQLMDFHTKYGFEVLVCVLERGNEIIIPNGSVKLRAGDVVSFISSPVNAYKFFKKIGLGTHRAGSAMIIGGGKTSFYLTKFLSQSGIQVKLIESNFDHCRELSEHLPDDVIIVNGDGTDESLLTEENIESTGAFIPLTGLDEANIVMSLYAMKVAPNIKAVTKINHISFTNVINELELGSVVYPRYITAEIIRTYVRALKNSLGSNIETLYRMFDDRVEAIEFKLIPGSKYTNIPIKDMKLKDNLLIASIIRNGKSFIPGGMDCFEDNDAIVIVTTHSGFDNISDIFA